MNIEFEDVLRKVNGYLLAHHRRQLNDADVGILRGIWAGLKYGEIAPQIGYQTGTVRGSHGPRLMKLMKEIFNDSTLNKSNLRDRVSHYLEQEQASPQPFKASVKHHWFGDLALDLPSIGRTSAIDQVLEAVHSAQLIMLTGPNGIGKTSFLSSVVQGCQDQFEVIFYCRGYEVPTVAAWTAQLQQALPHLIEANTIAAPTHHQAIGTTDDSAPIIALLKNYRCLFVFDRADDLLIAQAAGAPYGPDADYRLLLQRIVEARNHSCVLWVSPGPLGADIAPSWHGSNVVEIPLRPLTATEAQKLVSLQQPPLTLTGPGPAWEALTTYCGGNADLIQAAARYLHTQHAGQIVPPDQWHETLEIDALLQSKVNTLDNTEHALLWLLCLQSQTLKAIKEWRRALPIPTKQIDQAVVRLKYRHLLKNSAVDQPMCLRLPIMARYLLNQLIDRLILELQDETFHLFHRYPVLVPTADPQTQQAQQKVLLSPIADAMHRLCEGNQEQLQAKLVRLLTQAKQANNPESSQAVGNLINLASYLDLSIAGTDLRQSTIAHADLRTLHLTAADLSGCQFLHTVWASGLQAPLIASLSPQGTQLAIADEPGQVNFYNVQGAGLQLIRRASLTPGLCQMRFDQADLLSIASREQHLALWSSLEDAPVEQLSCPSPVRCMSFAAHAPRLAVGHLNGQVTLLDTQWYSPRTVTLSTAAIQAIALSAEGDQLATCTWDAAEIQLWTLPEERPPVLQQRIPRHRLGSIMALQWGPLGLQMVEEIEQRVYLKCSHGPTLPLPDRPELITLATFSDNGQYLAVGSAQHIEIYAITTAPPRPIDQLTRISDQSLTGLSLDNTGTWVCETTCEKVTLWHQATPQHIVSATTHPQLYQGCQLSQAQGLSTAEVAIAKFLGATV